MAMPMTNTVCTNSIDNALTLMELGDRKIKYTQLAKDFLGNVDSGEFEFLPPLSAEMIAYAQQRAIILFDLQKKRHKMHLLYTSFEESISDAFYNGDNIFYILLERFVDPNNSTLPPDYFVQKFFIDFNQAQLKKEIKIDKHGGFFLNNGNNIFVGNEKKVVVYDLNLNQISHPLSMFFESRKLQNRIKVVGLMVHPEHPFAILVEMIWDTGATRTTLIDWRKKEIAVSQLDMGDIGILKLSPDYRWMTYWRTNAKDEQLFTVKINPDNWDFMDRPVILGTFNRVITHNAVTWMPKPLSYILIDDQKELLYQWIFEEGSQSK